MSESVILWILGGQSTVILLLAGWLITHTNTCTKRWSGLMEKIGALHATQDALRQMLAAGAHAGWWSLISTTQLRAAMPYANADRIADFIQPLNNTCDEFGISTPARRAAFLAQLAHESGSLKYTRELASGEAYEGREDLGNRQPGDGVRYKGRGLIQVTGRANYAACGIALGVNLIERPELLEAPEGAARSAGWFWQSRGLNRLADEDKFGSLTKRINGGYTGLDDRIWHWLRARTALGVP